MAQASCTGSATAGGVAAALMLATSRLLASTRGPSSAVERSLASNAPSAQLGSAVRRAAITAAEQREVFGAASLRIVQRLQKPAFGVGAHSRLVRTDSELTAALGLRSP